MINGIYEDAGEYNGKRSYELTGNGWFIWWNDIDTWIISTIRGVSGDSFWTWPFPNIEGTYEPNGGASDGATVTEI